MPPRDSYQCCSEIDYRDIWEAQRQCAPDDVLAAPLVREPLSYAVGGRWRFVRQCTERDGLVNHRLSETPRGAAIDALLTHAQLPRASEALVDHLAQLEVCSNVPRPHLESYLRQIASAGLLRAVGPSLIDDDPLGAAIGGSSSALNASGAAARWRRAAQRLAAIDAQADGGRADAYDAVLRSLETAEGRIPRLNVVLAKHSDTLHLRGTVREALSTAVSLLHDITEPVGEPSVEHFAERFSNRFGDEEVPLLHALDQDFGLGFQNEGAPASTGGPFAGQLLAPPRTTRAAAPRWTERDAHLLERLRALPVAPDTELALTADDRTALRARLRAPLPPTFHVRASLVARSAASVDRGDFRLLVRECVGPPAARLFARLCHGDARLRAHIDALAAAEARRYGEAIVAEVLYETVGRGVNVQRRAFLPQAVLALTPVMPRAGVMLLTPEDITVSVRGTAVLLRCPRIDRWIIPRVTSAHVYSRRSLPVYRFLHALQRHRSSATLKWEWGNLSSCSYLPRVRYGPLVLERASWKLESALISHVKALSRAARCEWFRGWARAHRLPPRVLLCDGDRELLVDFDDPVMIGALGTHLASVPEGQGVRLSEWYPSPNDMCVSGPEGSYAHEIVATGITLSAEPFAVPAGVPPLRLGSTRATSGAGWVYYRIYCGPQVADRLLLSLGSELKRVFGAEGLSWFFVRYADPEAHLRLRFRVSDPDARAILLSLLPSFIDAHGCRDGIAKWEIGTYVPEVLRYGGPTLMPLAETVFCADSQWTVSMLRHLETRQQLNDGPTRWLSIVRGVHQLLVDFTMSQRERLDLCGIWRAYCDRRCGTDGAARRVLGQTFNRYRPQLLAAVAVDGADIAGAGSDVSHWRRASLGTYASAVMALRSANDAAKSAQDIALSLVHMCVNRGFDALDPSLELSVSDALYRVYDAGRHGPAEREAAP